MTALLWMRSSLCTNSSRTRGGCNRARLALLLCLVVPGAAFLAGCGSSPQPGAPAPPSASIPGNWEFTARITSSGAGLGETVPIGVYLTGTDTAVQGTAWVQMTFPLDCVAQCCGGPFADFSNALSGTLTGAGILNLTSSVPDNGPLFSMSGNMTGAEFTVGTFKLTGGCPATGAITGVEIPTLNGAYAGTLTSQTTGKSYNFSTTLAQSSALSTRGFFAVSGTGALTAYPCLSSVTVPTPAANYSGMLGDEFNLTMSGANGAQFSLGGTLSSDAETITVSYGVIGGSCANDIGGGTLTLQ